MTPPRNHPYGCGCANEFGYVWNEVHSGITGRISYRHSEGLTGHELFRVDTVIPDFPIVRRFRSPYFKDLSHIC